MISFRKISRDDLPLILSWRTDPEITRYMTTDIEYDLQRQIKWFEEVVSPQEHTQHWLITHKERPIGVLNLDDYNLRLNTTSWGYYIGDSESKFLGGLIPAYFYNYMFFKRDHKLKKI